MGVFATDSIRKRTLNTSSWWVFHSKIWDAHKQIYKRPKNWFTTAYEPRIGYKMILLNRKLNNRKSYKQNPCDQVKVPLLPLTGQLETMPNLSPRGWWVEFDGKQDCGNFLVYIYIHVHI